MRPIRSPESANEVVDRFLDVFDFFFVFFQRVFNFFAVLPEVRVGLQLVLVLLDAGHGVVVGLLRVDVAPRERTSPLAIVNAATRISPVTNITPSAMII